MPVRILPLIADQNQRTKLAFLLHAGFALSGIFTILLGPILPILAAQWSLNDSQTADFFAAQFLGTFSGVLLASLLIPRRGFRSSFVLSFLLMMAGSSSLARGSWVAALVSVFLYGAGTGFLTVATNLWVGEANPEKKSHALSVVNFSWTLGAVACPFLVTYFRGPHITRLFAGLAVASAVFMLIFAALVLDTKLAQAIQAAQDPTVKGAREFDRAAIVFGALFFLYVGTETALGGWLATYSRRILTTPGNLWVIAPSFFWGGLMLGRALTPAALRRFSEKLMLQAGALLGIAGTGMLIRASSIRGVFASAIVAGFGCATIFPILMAWLIAHYGFEARSVAGRMLAVAELGAAALPWLVGYLSALVGKLQEGLTILFATFLGVLLLLGSVACAEDRAATIIDETSEADGPR